jgi:predicted nucleic acid-binding protein
VIILDANILIRAVLGRRVRELLEKYGRDKPVFYTPDIAYTDAALYLPDILTKRGKSSVDVSAALEYLEDIVMPLGVDFYGAFEALARERIRRRDEEDWPILAAALALSCPVWTEDRDFFGTGIATWNTDSIEIFLRDTEPEAHTAQS